MCDNVINKHERSSRWGPLATAGLQATLHEFAEHWKEYYVWTVNTENTQYYNLKQILWFITIFSNDILGVNIFINVVMFEK